MAAHCPESEILDGLAFQEKRQNLRNVRAYSYANPLPEAKDGRAFQEKCPDLPCIAENLSANLTVTRLGIG